MRKCGGASHGVVAGGCESSMVDVGRVEQEEGSDLGRGVSGSVWLGDPGLWGSGLPVWKKKQKLVVVEVDLRFLWGQCTGGWGI